MNSEGLFCGRERGKSQLYANSRGSVRRDSSSTVCSEPDTLLYPVTTMPHVFLVHCLIDPLCDVSSLVLSLNFRFGSYVLWLVG